MSRVFSLIAEGYAGKQNSFSLRAFSITAREALARADQCRMDRDQNAREITKKKKKEKQR